MPLLVAPTLAARSAETMHLLRVIYALALFRTVVFCEQNTRLKAEVPERPVPRGRRHTIGPDMLLGDVAQH